MCFMRPLLYLHPVHLTACLPSSIATDSSACDEFTDYSRRLPSFATHAFYDKRLCREPEVSPGSLAYPTTRVHTGPDYVG
jgi:hypothetical protein